MSDMKLREDFEQHVTMRVVGKNGRRSSQLLIGTAPQIAEAVKGSISSALSYGETSEITLVPVPPYEVVKLPR